MDWKDLNTVRPALIADAGLPMIFVTLPAMLWALLPVIAIEAIVVRHRLNLSLGHSLRLNAVSNALSTLVGMPLTWPLLVLGQLFTGGSTAINENTPIRRLLAVTWQAPWLIPDERNMHWKIPAAVLFLLIPFFFASWLSEYGVMRWRLRAISPSDLRSGVLQANLASYSILFVGTVIWLLSSKPPIRFHH